MVAAEINGLRAQLRDEIVDVAAVEGLRELDGAAIDVGIRTLLLPPAKSGTERGLMAALALLD